MVSQSIFAWLSLRIYMRWQFTYFSIQTSYPRNADFRFLGYLTSDKTWAKHGGRNFVTSPLLREVMSSNLSPTDIQYFHSEKPYFPSSWIENLSAVQSESNTTFYFILFLFILKNVSLLSRGLKKEVRKKTMFGYLVFVAVHVFQTKLLPSTFGYF